MPCGGCKDELICVRGCRAAAMALLSLLVLLLLLLRVLHWIYCLETRYMVNSKLGSAFFVSVIGIFLAILAIPKGLEQRA